MSVRFEDLLEAAPDGMLITDHEGRILFVNERACTLFGYGREELAGASVDVLVPERSRAAHATHRRDYHVDAKTRPMGVARDLSGRRKDGSEFPVEVSLSPIRVDGGGVVVAVRDVTERKKLEARLVASDRLAALGTLTAGIAHEINNPLTYVTLNLDLTLEGLRRPSEVTYSDRVHELELLVMAARDGAERVKRIVSELKRSARTAEEPASVVDLHAVLDRAVRMSLNEIRYRASLARSYGDLPRVAADEARLVQVFVNLLVNAAQAIPEGHPDDNEIRLTTRAGDGGRAIVEVRDTGVGIPRDVQSHVFDPFFTTKPLGVGTGLGLYVSQGIVTSLGGEIEVESEPGVGTTMRVILPAAHTASRSASAPARAFTPKSEGYARILIIDDDVHVARSIRLALGPHDAVIVNSAKAALARLESGERFDMILCDLMMAEMTGMELYDVLAEKHPDLLPRMVFMTGGAFTARATEFLARIPNERLEKPFSADVVRSPAARLADS